MQKHVVSNGHLVPVVLAAVHGGEERDDGGEERGLQNTVTHLLVLLGAQDWIAAGETLLQHLCVCVCACVGRRGGGLFNAPQNINEYSGGIQDSRIEIPDHAQKKL